MGIGVLIGCKPESCMVEIMEGKTMLYARTPSRGMGGWSGPPPRAQTVPQTVHMHMVLGPIVCQEAHQKQHQQQTKAP